MWVSFRGRVAVAGASCLLCGVHSGRHTNEMGDLTVWLSRVIKEGTFPIGSKAEVSVILKSLGSLCETGGLVHCVRHCGEPCFQPPGGSRFL